MNTNKNWKTIIRLCGCLCFLLGVMFFPFSASAAEVLTPHVLNDGSKADFNQEAIASFNSDGEKLVTLRVPQNGAVRIRLAAATRSSVIVEVYEKADASDLPHYIRTDCTSDLWTTGFVMRYFAKGTYYIRLPEDSYRFGLVEYPSRNLTLKSGTTIAAFCDYEHENTYTFKAPGNGYIMVTKTAMESADGTMTTVLCNSKGTPLTESSLFSQTQDNKVSYAVKKGVTYKIKVKALNVNDAQYYRLNLKYAAVKEKSGSSKKKAVALKFSSKVSGTIFAEDKATQADWYKINNTKSQQMLLNYSGSITSGCLLIDVYDTKGKKLDSYSVIANVNEQKEDLLHNASGSTKMPKGTYYLKVTKSKKSSSGIYSFSLYAK